MTESEAIKILQRDLQIQLENKALPDGIEAIQIAIQSLEKQIPKKPNKAIDSSWGIQKEVHTCPVCEYYEKCNKPEREIKCMGYNEKEKDDE